MKITKYTFIKKKMNTSHYIIGKIDDKKNMFSTTNFSMEKNYFSCKIKKEVI